MAFSKLNGKGIDLSSNVLTDFASTGIDDNATSTAITINSSNFVGIGTDLPADILHVKKTDADAEITLETAFTGGDARLRMKASSSGISSLQFQDENDSNVGFLNYDHSTNSMQFRVNDSEKMRINNSGNLGIGTTDPSAPLHVKVTEASTGETDPLVRFERFTSGDNAYLDITVDNSNNLIGFQSTGTSDGGFTFGGASTERMRITNTGNVGINTDDPSALLEIAKTGAGAQLLLTQAGTDQLGLLAGTQGAGIVYEDENYFAIWSQDYADRGTENNLTERMRITSGGVTELHKRLDIKGITSGSYVIADDGTNGRFQINPTSTSEVSLLAATTGFAAWGALNLKGTSQIMTYGPGSGTEIARFDTNGLSIKYGGTFHAQTNTNATTTYQNNGQDGTYNKTVLYTNINNTSASITNGLYLELGRITDSSSAETRKFHIAMRGGQSIASFDADGLKFGTDTAAANALDDYEEGTFTAHVKDTNDNATYITSTATSRYVKIGSIVTAFIVVYAQGASAHTFVGTPYIEMPYTPGNNAGSYTAVNPYYLVGMGSIVSGYLFNSNGNKLMLATSDTTPFSSAATGFAMGSGNKRFYATITYAV